MLFLSSARLKSIPADKIAEEVDARLRDVALEEAADLESGAYSGGMQVRQSYSTHPLCTSSWYQ